jgi:hypothetical protein
MATSGVLFINPEKVSAEVKKHLDDINVKVEEYNAVFAFLK